MGTVTGVDLQAKSISFQLRSSRSALRLEYDHLVLAPGSVTRLPEVPGLREHGFEIKSLSDAVQLRDHVIQQLELADAVDDPILRRRLLHVVVVGANFTGVEAAGELQVFLSRAGRKYRRVRAADVAITLVELGQRILPALDQELADYALHQLERRGMHVEMGTTISRVEAGHAHLKDGRELATETVIWCAGIAPSPLIGRLDLPTDSRGYLLCETDLRVRGEDDVWAIGDSAVNVDAEGHGYPATAQHAVQQGNTSPAT
jgi:NADH dehydrogenase